MDVRVVKKGLCPGVKDGGEADPGAEVLRVRRNFKERLRCGCEQETVGHPWIRQKERVELLRDREDYVA